MTKEELARIAEALRTHEGTPNWAGPYGTGGDDVYDDLAAVLAEVRRLRGLLSALVEAAPAWPGDRPDQVCVYCDADLSYICTHGLSPNDPHAADCPWRLAYEALHSPSRVR